MYVKRIKLRNVRGFDEVDLDLTRPDGSLSGWTVLAGRNGSGKTTLLKAVALAAAGANIARALSASFADWIRVGESEAEARIQLEFTSADLVVDPELMPPWTHLSWKLAGEAREPSLSSNSSIFFKEVRTPEDEDFDIVLLYNDNDWQEVSKFANDLMQRGIRPWIDRRHLRPGVLREAVEATISKVRKVAVCLGRYGGPSLKLIHFIEALDPSQNLVIPIFLRAFEKNNAPSFIWRYQGVDFRESDPQPLDQLARWLKGKDNGNNSPSWPESNLSVDWFLAAYGPYRRLSGHAVDAQRLMEGPEIIARLVSLFREDSSLIECIAWLREIYLQHLENKPGAAELEHAVIGILNDGLLPDNVVVDQVDSEGLWVQQRGIRLPLHELSDGYRTTAALIMDIVRHLHATYGKLRFATELDQEGISFQILNGGVVLIDEVDLHLHVSWQKGIGFWLKRHFPNIQFIVTTHSPFVCQAADPRGLIRLPAPGENRSAEHVSEALYNTVVNGGADDAVLTELFGLDTPYSDESERLRKRIAQLEALLQSGKVSDKERKELKELRSRLPQTLSADVEQVLRTLAINE